MVEKLERQLSLLATLLHTAVHLTASDLHERIDGYPDDKVAFRRAFERDKDDLRRLGIPIDVAIVEQAGGSIQGYRVDPSEYYLHDLGLTEDESVALALALRVIRLEGDPSADEARWKLGGVAGHVAMAPDELGRIAIGPALTPVQQALGARLSIGFDFRGERRTVEPWRMAYRNGHWYVAGYDVDRDAERRFRLDRVEGSVEVLHDRPALRPRGRLDDERQPWEFGSGDDAVVARLAIDASHAEWARRTLSQALVVAERDDGSIEVELAITNRVGFRNLVLGMYDAAEVLAPPEIRADIIEWLEAQA